MPRPRRRDGRARYGGVEGALPSGHGGRERLLGAEEGREGGASGGQAAVEVKRRGGHGQHRLRRPEVGRPLDFVGLHHQGGVV